MWNFPRIFYFSCFAFLLYSAMFSTVGDRGQNDSCFSFRFSLDFANNLNDMSLREIMMGGNYKTKSRNIEKAVFHSKFDFHLNKTSRCWSWFLLGVKSVISKYVFFLTSNDNIFRFCSLSEKAQFVVSYECLPCISRGFPVIFLSFPA